MAQGRANPWSPHRPPRYARLDPADPTKVKKKKTNETPPSCREEWARFLVSGENTPSGIPAVTQTFEEAEHTQ